MCLIIKSPVMEMLVLVLLLSPSLSRAWNFISFPLLSWSTFFFKLIEFFMSEFYESFFESTFKERLLIIDFCVMSSEAGVSGIECSDFNTVVLCAIVVSIRSCVFVNLSCNMLFSLCRKAISDFNISLFTKSWLPLSF